MGSTEETNAIISRTFEENLAFIEQDAQHEYLYHVRIGFIPNMKVMIVEMNDFLSIYTRIRLGSR